MKMTRKEKFLLALLLAGCLTCTNVALAEKRTVTGQTITEQETVKSGDINSYDDCAFEVTGTADNGGAINNDGVIVVVDEQAGEFSGGITGSTFTGNAASSFGGAIYNGSAINEISGSRFDGKNSAVSGGAIYNATSSASGNIGTIGTIGDTTFEYNEATTGNGGAIYNDQDAAIGAIGGTAFEHNTAAGNGGAIYNAGTIGYASYDVGEISFIGEGPIQFGDFAWNEAANGGAIYNDKTGIIGTDDSTGIYNVDFVENRASESGGAIYNAGVIAEISSIDDSTFEDNKALGGDGGAIYNAESGSIGNIEVYVFEGNEAAGNGGAIYNAGTIGSATYTIDGEEYTVPGGISSVDFEENLAVNGGAIYNSGSITYIDGGDYEENKVTGDGGAIYNTGTISSIREAEFEGNEAAGDGGAIYNTGTLGTLTNVSFEGNVSGGKGGAIYTTADLTFVADGSDDDDDDDDEGGEVDVHFSDNAAAEGGDAIYMDNASGTITFQLTNGGTVALEDSIDGQDGYTVAISGDSLDTTFYLFGDLNNANFSVGNTTLNTINDATHEYAVKSFTLTGDVNFVADIDLANGEMDRITAESYGEHQGTLTVTGLNILSDATNDSVSVYFAEPGLMDNVKSEVGSLPDSEHQTAYSPMSTYDVEYVTYDDGGYFVLDRTSVNPAVMATSYAAMGAYNAMGLMYESNFEHSDYFMKLSAEDRLALSEQQKKAKRAPKENDATKPAYYNRHELTERGAWMRAFASNESVDYGGGWESRDKYYGATVGFDSALRDHGNGWASVLTGYAGMLGIRQTYSGGNNRQKGGFVGVTGSFYKKNFYTAWTIAAGTTKAHEYTMYGHDNSRLNEYGIAGRFGWNIPLGDGKFSLLPTFTAAFTYVDTQDFTNAGGVKMTGDGFYAVQLNPNIKFIMNVENGWQPYLTVGEVWTVGDSSKIYANDSKLDEFDLDPYTEYGIGVQKRWANRSDAYLQLLGHSHGRDGFLVNAGVRWSF